MPDTERYAKVSVLVPTRQRVERLKTLIASYLATTGGEHSELVFRVDDDDAETIDFLARDYLTVVGPRLNGYDSMPTFFNEMAAAASGDVLLCGNDDMVFASRGWPEAIFDVANRFPDGLFDLGVTTHNEAHYPFSIVSKRAVDRMGFLWDPRIFWGDIFLRDTMMHFGRCFMLPHVKIDHDWAGFKPDRVFAESCKDPTVRDPTYWSGTHRVAVDQAVEVLMGLLQ